jgi:hypothetical protein
MRSLLRSRSLPNAANRFAHHPQRLEKLVGSKWLFWRNFARVRKKRLPAPLYVTLTSYPPRFRALATTIKCLLMQACAPDAVVLWIAEDDMAKLPGQVTALRRFGLQIRACPDLRSYKKIVPALEERPQAFWVTADDDCYYPPNWLDQLVRAWTPYSREVLCHRAHRIRLDSNQTPLPYTSWELELRAESAHPLNFMTGVGGVLYPPGCFANEVTDQTLFQRLCPGSDDVWLWWMLRRKGFWVRKVGGPWSPICWPESQKISLYQENVLDRGNDSAIENMVSHFGFPGQQEVQPAAI